MGIIFALMNFNLKKKKKKNWIRLYYPKTKIITSKNIHIDNMVKY